MASDTDRIGESGGRGPQQAGARTGFRPIPGVLVGLALLPPTVVWTVYNETVLGGALATQMSLPLNVVLVLALLVGLNSVIGRLRPRWRLSRAQLLIAYVVLVVGTSASGFWYTQALPMFSGYMAWYCTPGRGGDTGLGSQPNLSSVVDALPSWFIVKDEAALKAFYEGADETTALGEYWRSWLPPMAWWVLFFAVLVYVFLCLSVLLRRQWSDRERLNFPLTQVPLAMTEPATPLYRNGLLWLGILLAGSVDALNNLHRIYPMLPRLNVEYVDLADRLGAWGFPWSTMQWGSFGVSFYPFVIGLGFLMPLDVLFSFWFFYLLWNVLRLVVAGLGYPYPGSGVEGFPYIPDQVQGGYLALGLMALWASRPDFRRALLQLLRRVPRDGDPEEAISYPHALVGAVTGAVVLILLLTSVSAAPAVSAVFIIGFLVISLSIARLRAEFGAPFHDLEYNTPDVVMPKVLGSVLLGPRALGMLSMQFWYTAENFTHPMPHSMEALRIGSTPRTGARQKPFFWGVLVAWVVGMSLCIITMLYFGQQLGYMSGKVIGQRTAWYGGATFARLDQMLGTPTGSRPHSMIAIVVGMLTCFGLQAMRMRMPGWPLDPVTYSLASTATASSYWLPLLLAWVFKSLILRYGGRRGYGKALPFFLGLVIGEAFVGAGWSLVGCFLQQRTYRYYYF